MDGGMRSLQQDAHRLGLHSSTSVKIDALLGVDQLVTIWPPEDVAPWLPVLQAALSVDPLRPAPEPKRVRAWPLLRSDDERPDVDALFLGPLGAKEAPTLPLDLSTWEARLRSTWRRTDDAGRTTWISVVSRVRGDGARRALLVRNWRRLPSLCLSAGGAWKNTQSSPISRSRLPAR